MRMDCVPCVSALGVACGRDDGWFVRLALWLGIEYDGGKVSETAGASLTLGQKYGARFIVHFGEAERGSTPALFQMGGYVSF